VTTSLERNDISISSYDSYISPMPKAVEAYADARNDYDIFSGLAEKLGFRDAFTEGRDEKQWLKYLYKSTRDAAAEKGVNLPEFESFWEGQQIGLAEQLPEREFILEKYRQDPDANALGTPSGKIELYSKVIEGFQYEDCRAHPVWYEGQEWLGSKQVESFPLHLISNQPKTRLHSQYDHGVTSRNAKIKQRAPARMNPEDARTRNIESGDIVRLFNERGSCLAGIELTENIRPGVVELETGAWFDPNDELSLEVHGNPNVLTRDVGTSTLAQGPTAHSCLVDVEKYTEELPPICVFSPPLIEIKD
jgi:biotin/methionine sulfoxide reductase